MSQQETIKTTKTPGDIARDTLQAVQEAEEEAIAMGQHNVENMARTASNYNKAFGEFTGLYSGNMHACVECGNRLSKVLREMNAELMDDGARTFSELSALSREAMTAKTPDELAAVSTRLSQFMVKHYYDEAAKLSEFLFDGYAKAFEPLQKNGLSNQNRLQKLLTFWNTPGNA